MFNSRTLYNGLIAAVLLLVGVHASLAQPIRFRAVNLVEGSDSVDIYLNNGTNPYIRDLVYQYVSAQSPNLTLGATIDLKVTSAGQPIGSAFLSDSLAVPGGYYYTAVLYGTEAAPEISLIERRIDQVPATGNALLRFFNASTVATAFDIYLHSTDSTPIVTGLVADSASSFVTIEARSSTLIVTATGSKTPMVALDAPVNDRAILTMIITGSSENDLTVYALNGSNVDEHLLPELQPHENQGSAPTLRFVNVLPAADARQLDVYVDGVFAADSIAYRGASGILPRIAEGTEFLRLVPAGQSPTDSVYGEGLVLNRDTAYSMILTQFSGGRVISMTIGRSLSLPPLSPGSAAIRFANTNDFRRTVSVALLGADTATFMDESFLEVSEWRVINAGALTLQAFVPGVASPIFQGAYTVRAGEYLTLIGIGDDTSYVVDVLRETEPGPQIPMESFGQQQTAVRDLIVAGRELRLRAQPNPIGHAGRIAFELAASGNARVDLYDAVGRPVAVLADGWRNAGMQTIAFDASSLASGSYTLVLTSGGKRGAERLIVAD